MLYSLKRHPIILYFEKNHDTVTSVANDYLESTQESPTGKIAEALEDIIRFSFGNKEDSKAIGQEMVDLTTALIKRHSYDFRIMMFYQLKLEVIRLTTQWAKRNRLRASLRRSPWIYHACFAFCFYYYAEVIKMEKSLKGIQPASADSSGQ